jgi:Animal haem peroxidase
VSAQKEDPAGAEAALEAPGHARPGHGSESFFVLGEGLLTESRGGREGASDEADTRLRAAAAAAPPFRFSRMGPKGRALPRATRVRVARAMTAGGGGFSGIPSGYTYLGQFIDHDLTFDKTTVTLGADVSPADLLQGRSPSLDLDSLYGAGPNNPGSERFYAADGRKLQTGKTEAVGTGRLGAKQGFDLPRSASAKHATIPDHRNDENLAVAQTHLAFIRFHNRVVDQLAGVAAAKRFGRARRLVVKHYQWMIRHDYLPRICEPSVVDDVFAHGRKAFEVGVAPTAVPTMPIEFSIAAFRLGHSMVRREYSWNVEFDDGAGTLGLLFEFSGTSGSLGDGVRLPTNWIADWRRLYAFKQTDLKAPRGKLNHARTIDTLLANPLGALPPGSFGATTPPASPLVANLAFRNLARAKMVRLATGQGMVAFLKSRGVSVTALTKAQIRNGDGGAKLDGLTTAQRTGFVEHTPLWFYVLREAELNGGRLTGVGARIVAETFHRAMEGSSASIVREPDFKPRFGPNTSTFDMRDLLFFAFEGKKALLNPLGD